MEELIKQMKELTDLIREHHEKQDTATLDWDEVQEKFEEQIKALVEAQIKAYQDAQPVHRAPASVKIGHSIARDWDLLKDNRYNYMLRDIATDGYHQFGTLKVKPVDFWLTNYLLEKAAPLLPDRIAPPSDDLKAALKAMSTGTGVGGEYVPTEMAADLWPDFFLNSLLVSTLITVDQPSNPFDLPLGLGQTTWRKGAQNTATTATDLATAKVTLTVTELVTEVNWSYTLEEDAIIAMMPTIRTELTRGGGEIMDDFLLNADATNAPTGNINLVDADPADDSYYLSDGQDGIRHQWLVDNAAQGVDALGAALADTHIVSALTNIGKYAVNPRRVVLTTDISTYLKGLLSLDSVLTIDKFGPDAVLLTGQLAAYRGIPIIPSAVHRLANAAGKISNTPGNNTLGSLTIYNRDMWRAGFVRELLIEVDRDIQKRQFIMVVSLRESVGAHGTRSTNTHTAGVYNINVT